MSVVAKFGSSVLKDDESYLNVALELLVLKAIYDKVYTVLSAEEGETDRLIQSVAGDEANILQSALLGYSKAPKFETPEVSKALIQGEFKSVDNLVDILKDNAIGVKQTENYPITAHGSYLYGHVLLPESRIKAKAIQNDKPIEIVSGFGAVDLDGNVVLLGRNASDYVASIYAHIYNAKKLIYYKDVDGIYVNFCKPNQKKLDIITRQEFLGLGSMKVLDQRVLDVYGGDIWIKKLHDLGKIQQSFSEAVKVGIKVYESHIKHPESGTLIRGVTE